MKALIVSFGLALGVTLGGCVGGQVTPREGMPGPETHRFDPGAVETVDGRVLGVDRAPPSDTLATGVRLKLGGDDGPVSVDLAPGWYLDQKGLHFATNERVRIRGSRVHNAIVAQEITAGGRVIQLRDSQGRPLWRPKPPAPQTPRR